MHSSSGSTVLRGLALAVILANVAFNYLYQRLGWGPAMEVVSARYATALTPAGYAFAIWGIIYTAFVVYAVQSLRRPQQREHVYDALALPLIVVNVLGTAWILAYTRDFLGLSVVLILASVIAGAMMFVSAAQYAPARNSLWLRVPFSLYFGWITVAALACITQWMQARGWVATPGGETTVTVLFVLFAGAAGAAVALHYRDWIYPAVVAWATFAIAVAQRDSTGAVALTAWGVGLAMLGMAAYALYLCGVELRLRRGKSEVVARGT